jgi:Zn-dependent protease with chaperone function
MRFISNIFKIAAWISSGIWGYYLIRMTIAGIIAKKGLFDFTSINEGGFFRLSLIWIGVWIVTSLISNLLSKNE